MPEYSNANEACQAAGKAYQKSGSIPTAPKAGVWKQSSKMFNGAPTYYRTGSTITVRMAKSGSWYVANGEVPAQYFNTAEAAMGSLKGTYSMIR